MINDPIIPVLLAGGVGSRLWPISRESFPKQFCKIFDEFSLLQKTAERAQSISEASPLIVVTNDNYYFLCKDQLEVIDRLQVHYILEPCPRNTAPAIALAAHYARHYIHLEAVLLVLPCDHYLKNYDYFKEAIQSAVHFTEQNQLVVFGIEPDGPKTGYGYIEKGRALEAGGFKVNQFIEKPSASKAEALLLHGDFYWNSGMFLFKALDYLNELEHSAQDIGRESRLSFEKTQANADFFRVDKQFQACRAGSIDYEVMEKTQKAVMLPLRTAWSDLGCWTSVSEMSETDETGNACYGDVMIDQCQNCLISSDGRRVVAIGIKDQVVVSTPDAVLVIDKKFSQQVKMVVEQMKLRNDVLAVEHHRIYRPWGFYEKLGSGQGYQVKCLMVHPKAALSLQLHQHRAEHWVIVHGEAEVVNGDAVFRLFPNQSTYIEKCTRHRLSNPGDEPLFVIEVQSGDYLGEDDITRFDDVYGREDETTAHTMSKV